MTKTINVYFNGTGEPITNLADEKNSGKNISLASLLHALTLITDNHSSICQEGCGINNNYRRDFDGIFAYRLEQQVTDVAKKIEEELKKGEDVVLNVFGFSRGGIAAFLLCQKLKHIPKERLKINVVSLDPVPGNFITTTRSDVFFGTYHTLTLSVADMTNCHNVEKMLILFTNVPLADWQAHAPILPAAPDTCQTEVDVMPGCHAEAAAFYRDLHGVIHPHNDESILTFYRIVKFMQQCGTVFDFTKINMHEPTRSLVTTDTAESKPLKQLFVRLVHSHRNVSRSRSMHLNNTIFTNSHQKPYLNRFHQRLIEKENKVDIDDSKNLLSLNQWQTERDPHYVLRYTRMVAVFALFLFLCYNYLPAGLETVKNYAVKLG